MITTTEKTTNDLRLIQVLDKISDTIPFHDSESKKLIGTELDVSYSIEVSSSNKRFYSSYFQVVLRVVNKQTSRVIYTWGSENETQNETIIDWFTKMINVTYGVNDSIAEESKQRFLETIKTELDNTTTTRPMRGVFW